MSASLRKRRLALFARGNDKCPICLTLFTKRDVELGKATLEHVPPKAFGVDSIAMCLTCKACNNSASRVEQVAAAAHQDEQKLQITIPRLVDEKGKPLFHTGYGTISGKNSMLLRMGPLRVSESEFGDAMRSGEINVKFVVPTAHYTNTPMLKAAYLMVFSLLGVHGYRYAAGSALKNVRRQIMEPGKEIIPRFAFKLPEGVWPEGRNVFLSREIPCWAVRVGEIVVLLPRSWDTSFYERISGLDPAEVTMRGELRCPSVKFGQMSVMAVPARTSDDFDPLKTFGEDLFGAPGEVTQKNVETQKRVKVSFVVVDCGSWGITALTTSVAALPRLPSTASTSRRRSPSPGS